MTLDSFKHHKMVCWCSPLSTLQYLFLHCFTQLINTYEQKIGLVSFKIEFVHCTRFEWEIILKIIETWTWSSIINTRYFVNYYQPRCVKMLLITKHSSIDALVNLFLNTALGVFFFMLEFFSFVIFILSLS